MQHLALASKMREKRNSAANRRLRESHKRIVSSIANFVNKTCIVRANARLKQCRRRRSEMERLQLVLPGRGKQVVKQLTLLPQSTLDILPALLASASRAGRPAANISVCMSRLSLGASPQWQASSSCSKPWRCSSFCGNSCAESRSQ